MSHFPIYCLMNAGRPLTEMAADVLYRTACLMMKKQRAKMAICHDDFGGAVTTDFDAVNFAGIAGVVFDGVVENDKGCNKVRFIVTEGDYQAAKDAEWFLFDPEEDQWKSLREKESE